MKVDWHLNGLTPAGFVKRIAQRSWDDEVFGQSARLAFYFFFALFPLLLLLLMVLAKLSPGGSAWRSALLDSLNQILPLDVSRLLASMVGQLTTTAVAGGGALIAAGSAVWGILNGTRSILKGLNDAYEVEECRSFWRLVVVTVGMTVCLCGLAFTALGAIRMAGDHPAGLGTLSRGRQAAEWAITIVLHAVCFALLYRFGPSLGHRQWKHSIPGAAIAAVLWAVFTSGLRIYQHFALSTQKIYGGLTPVAQLLMWLYLIGGAIFLGGEANAVLAKAGREHG